MKLTTSTAQTQVQSPRDAASGQATGKLAQAAGTELAASGTKDLAADVSAKDLDRVNNFLKAFSDLKLRSADTCGNYNYA